MVWNGAREVRKRCPICFNKFDCKLLIYMFSQFAFYLSLSLSRFKKCFLAQLCCRLSVVVTVWFATNGMCVKNNTNVARTSRNEMITTWDLYCCLVLQGEPLCTCCSTFLITMKWYFDQDVKLVPGTIFTKRTCNMCGSLQKQWDVVATSRLALHWKCGFRMPNTWKRPKMNM